MFIGLTKPNRAVWFRSLKLKELWMSTVQQCGLTSACFLILLVLSSNLLLSVVSGMRKSCSTARLNETDLKTGGETLMEAFMFGIPHATTTIHSLLLLDTNTEQLKHLASVPKGDSICRSCV